MSYYVYENWPNKKAMIHKATCSRCNHGQGVSHGKAGRKYGRWYGPFESIGQAEGKAESTGQFIYFCSFCKP